MAEGPGGLPVQLVSGSGLGPGGLPVRIVDPSSLPGSTLARATSQANAVIGVAEADLDAALTVTFTVPTDRDAWLVASIPGVGASTANATVTIKLTDGANVLKKNRTVSSSTANRNYVGVLLTERFAAGSGTITRKLRGQSTTADGFFNILAADETTIDVFIR